MCLIANANPTLNATERPTVSSLMFIIKENGHRILFGSENNYPVYLIDFYYDKSYLFINPKQFPDGKTATDMVSMFADSEEYLLTYMREQHATSICKSVPTTVSHQSYQIVCLIGSSKFKKEFQETAREYTLSGHCVLTLDVFEHAGEFDDDVPYEDQKKIINAITDQKIEMADVVLVINKDNYIGESTQEQINYAKSLGKNVVMRY